jgi:hypothetical protein
MRCTMKTIQHKFVQSVPEVLEDNILYISIIYKGAIHKCACGCGSRVSTPLTPKDWKLIFDGETVSLSPSIGNYQQECRSHYFIEKNNIRFVPEVKRKRKEEKPSKKKRWNVLNWK